MRSKKLRFACAALAVGMVLPGITGCKKSNSTQTSSDQYANKPMEITVEAMDNGTCPASEGTVENNRWTKWINQNSGVKVTFVSVPRTSATDKIKAMFAAGTAPDVVWDYGSQGALQRQGVLLPLDSLIKQYSTSYKAYINSKDNADLVPYTKMSDGKTWFMTSRRTILQLAVHGMYIRKDWLDKLNLKMPTTDQELLNVARAFVKDDPDGDGKADTVAFSFGSAFNARGYSNMIRGMFGCGADYCDNGKYYISDTTMYDSPRMKDALSFRKTLYDEGLIDKEYVTDTTFSRENQLFTTGKAGMYWGTWDISKNYRKLLANVPNADIEPIPLIKTKYGTFPLFQNAPPAVFVAINKNCKNPKAAIKYLDWMMSKGWFTLKYGEKDVHYKLVDGVPQAIDADKNTKEIGYSGLYALLAQDDIKVSSLPTRAASDSISQKWAQLEQKELNIIFSKPYKRLSPNDHADINDTTNLLTFASVKQNVDAKLIMGGKDYSVDWALSKLKGESKRLGGDTVTKETEDLYKKNKTADDKWETEYEASVKKLLK